MVSYGGGANSTALLIGLHQHRIPVDLILFADTGAEHPHTYAYLEVMDRWLKDHGMPPITRVYKTTRDGKRLTLEDECLQSCSLPSIAYGFKRCSLKHMQREIQSQLQDKGIGTKAQQALKLQHEQYKLERKTKSREQKETEKGRQFAIRQEKKKAKHRGR